MLIQHSVLKPEKGAYLVPDAIYESLSLLLKLFQYEKETIRVTHTSETIIFNFEA
jgi:hypothetical protein